VFPVNCLPRYFVALFFCHSKRNNEQKLLQLAKDYTNKLAQQKQELDKADLFPENSNTEVSKLRQKLLQHNNDLAETEERQYQLDYKITW
jgi:predicted  nucleic acid-binding Zn-ribbon protein